MAFATAENVASRLGRTLATSEEAPVALLLDSATALIADAAGQDDDWAAALDPIPGVVKATCIEMVTRALANPQALQSMQEQLGAHSFSVKFGPGIFLTDAERRIVKRAFTGTFLAVTLESPYSGDVDDDDSELPLDE